LLHTKDVVVAARISINFLNYVVYSIMGLLYMKPGCFEENDFQVVYYC